MADGEEDYIVRGPPLEYVAQYSSAGKFIFDRLKKDPVFIGQIEAHTAHEYTFGEILDRTMRFASWLRDMDIGPGDVVCYVTVNHKDVIIVVYAMLFVGAVLNPLDIGLTTQEIAYFMDLTKPKMVICSKDAAVLVKTAAEVLHVAPVFVVHGELSGFISFEDTQVHSKTQIDNFQCTEVDENDIAWLVCTSGSTGLPKMIPRSHKSILFSCQMMEKHPFIGSVLITFAPICWTGGLLVAINGPSAKVQRVVASYFDEESAWKWIETYQVNCILMTPPLFSRLIYSNSISHCDISSLRMVVIGGAPFGIHNYKKFEEFAPVGCKLFDRYSISEMAGPVTAVRTGEIIPYSKGTLMPGVSGKIIDPRTGKTISPYELGEICLKHPNMLARYYKNPALTKLAIDSDGWYHTGDLGKFDKNGELYMIDKLKNMIEVNGFKVFPSELEDILAQHPGVKYVGVVGKSISSNLECPVAFVVKKLGSNITEAELCDFVKARIANDAKQLGCVRFIDEMPRSASGKIKQCKLRKMLESEA